MAHLRQVAVLLLVLAMGSSAFGQSKGTWRLGLTSDKTGLYAATVNDSNAVFGQYCYPEDGENGTCYWILANDIRCEAGSRYPVLVNSDAGAISTELLCFTEEKGVGRFAFSDFDQIEKIVNEGGRIAVAFPMASGLFQVNRFSLDGSASVVSDMRDRAASVQRQRTKSTKDRFL